MGRSHLFGGYVNVISENNDVIYISVDILLVVYNMVNIWGICDDYEAKISNVSFRFIWYFKVSIDSMINGF
jgi:hypothetical protein